MTTIPKTAWTALVWLAAAWAPAVATPANTACIFDQDIVSTTRPDDHTILFNMRDLTVWKNTTQSLWFADQSRNAATLLEPAHHQADHLRQFLPAW